MKALQYVQVLLLVAGLSYLAWFHFSNPNAVVFPVPLMRELPGSAAGALGLGALAGFLYAALLFAPAVVRRGASIRRGTRRVRELEAELEKLRPNPNVPVIPDRQ